MVNQKTKKEDKFDQYKYAITVGFGSFVLALVLLFTVGRFLYTELTKTSDVLKEKRAVREKLEENLSTLEELKKNEDLIVKDTKKAIAALPSDKDIARLFVQLEALASENGSFIRSVSEGAYGTQSLNSNLIKSVTYGVSVEVNDYSSIKNLFSEMNKALRILNVSSVDISPTVGGKYDLNISINTYTRSEE